MLQIIGFDAATDVHPIRLHSTQELWRFRVKFGAWSKLTWIFQFKFYRNFLEVHQKTRVDQVIVHRVHGEENTQKKIYSFVQQTKRNSEPVNEWMARKHERMANGKRE